MTAEAEAGLATLRGLLRVRGAPEDLVPAALAEVPADIPPRTPDEGGDALRLLAGDTRRRRLTAGAVLAVVAVVVAAVVIPLSDRTTAAEAETPAATASAPGLLDWPARGPLAGDAGLLRAALTAWRAAVPVEQAPSATSVLYAGGADGAPVVLLQGVDPKGLGWVARLTRAGTAAPELTGTEPLGRGVPFLAVDPAAELGRLLAPPGGRLLARDGVELRPLTADADGITEPVAAGAVVALHGTGDATAVAGSGQVTPGRLTPVAGGVEIGTARIDLGRTADVGADWYGDGQFLTAKLGAPVTVAALGPRLARSVGGRAVRARTYEVVSGGDTWVSSVVRFGRTTCVDGSNLGTVAEGADVPVVVRRCAPADSAFGVLHVLAGKDVGQVQVLLAPGRRGQKAVRLTVGRRTPGAVAAGPGFTLLVPVAAMPSGPAEIRAVSPRGRLLATVRMGGYRAPRR